jgi:hypothetical protein
LLLFHSFGHSDDEREEHSSTADLLVPSVGSCSFSLRSDDRVVLRYKIKDGFFINKNVKCHRFLARLYDKASWRFFVQSEINESVNTKAMGLQLGSRISMLAHMDTKQLSMEISSVGKTVKSYLLIDSRPSPIM